MTDTQSASDWPQNGSAVIHPNSASAGTKTDAHVQADVTGYLKQYLSLDEFEPAAQRRLPRMLYGYAASGTETDASIHRNRESYANYALVPRVLTGAGSRDPKCTLFGQSYAAPFGIAPMGAQ